MTLALVGAGAGLLAVPGLLGRHGRFLRPDAWARAVAGLILAGLVVVELGLLLTSAPTVLRATGFAHLATMCERSFGRLTAGGDALAWTAGGLALVLPAFAVLGLLRARRAQRDVVADPWLGIHHDHGTHEVVVLPTAGPLAIATPGPPPQILVSSGLCTRLSDDDLAVVMSHEEAHLRRGHHRYLLLACAVEAVPGALLVRRSTAALRVALERWADEEAVLSCRDGRPGVRRALARYIGDAVEPALAGFGTEGVVERVEALDHPIVPSWPAWIPVVVLATGALSLASVASIRWVGELQTVLATTGICLS